MNDEQNPKGALKPSLRFPEFREAKGWQETRLYEIAEPISQKAETSGGNNILTLSGEHGLVLQSEYFGKKIAGDNTERYIKINRNDFVYNDRTTKLSTYGSIKRLSRCDDGMVSPIYKCFRFNAGENPAFWDWYFESGSHEAQLHGLINEGARTGRFNISIDRFLSTSVWVPNPSEQKKIADCLSSVGELITTEAWKLDALKVHKKGLIQQLFPTEGETVPSLRFPEFQEAGEWDVKPLIAICNMQAGKFVPAAEISERPAIGLYPCYGGNGLRGYTRTYTHSGKYPLIGRQGALCGNVTLVTGRFHATEHAVVATPNNAINIDWLFYRLVSLDLNRFATGQAQPGLSVEVLDKVFCAAPREKREQERIADCLSSIDELITTQNKKCDVLKAHKRGMMQQLFPVLDEVRG